jgi:hypothetical protein
MTNRSPASILACSETWVNPTGVISIQFYDISGNPVGVGLPQYRDALLDANTSLVHLAPGDSKSGTLGLDREVQSVLMSSGDYIAQAQYYCPFEGKETVDGIEGKVENALQWSNTVRFTIK